MISFTEFWDWWSSGRPNKLEKLVYYKLKASKLLKKAHGDFMRLGGSLESKYDDKDITHYFAINYGQDLGQSRASLSLHCGHSEIKSEIHKTLKGVKPRDIT